MKVSAWLSKIDVHNQEVVDALLGHADTDGSGILIESRWSQGDAGGYRERWGHLRIGDGDLSRLRWGATFHKLPPGAHRLQFGLRRRRGTWAEVMVSVPVDAHVRLEYQPAVWPWQRAVVTVIG